MLALLVPEDCYVSLSCPSRFSCNTEGYRSLALWTATLCHWPSNLDIPCHDPVEADVGYRYVRYGGSVHWALSFCLRIYFDPYNGWQRVLRPRRAHASVETARLHKGC